MVLTCLNLPSKKIILLKTVDVLFTNFIYRVFIVDIQFYFFLIDEIVRFMSCVFGNKPDKSCDILVYP